MISDWQTYAALLVVLTTVVLLVRASLKKRKTPGCGGGCGCPTGDLKAKLRAATEDTVSGR